MTMRRTILILLLLVSHNARSFAQGGNQSDEAAALAKLHWIKGPQTVPLFGVASVNIPEGYVFLNPADARTFNTLSHNPSSGTEYVLAPDDLRWISYFRFSEDGYVKDDEKIDSARILASLRKAPRPVTKSVAPTAGTS